MAPPAPVIEGTLKNTINSLGFGLITTVLSITFGKFLIPNFFVWIVSFVVFIEFVLLSLPRKKEEYELYQVPGRKVMHNIQGSGAPQISINSPDEEGSPKKKAGLRERLKKDKHGKKQQLSPDAADGGEGSETSKQTPSPKKSPKAERKAKDEAQKSEKATEKAEKAEKEKAEKTKEKSKGKGDSADNMAEDQDEEKHKKGKGSWKKRLPHRKSQSLSDD